MSEIEKPIQALYAQGWEPAGYSVCHDPTMGSLVHSFVLRRQSACKIVTVRKKVMGQGLVVEEMEV